jgi:hypothetical protein
MSYLNGFLCIMSLAIVLREPIPSAAVVPRIPWWASFLLRSDELIEWAWVVVACALSANRSALRQGR